MKRAWDIMKQYAPWLMMLLCIDGFAALLLWLADVRAFRALTAVIVLTSVLLAAAALGVAGYRALRREQAFFEFLNNPDEKQEELLVKLAGPVQRDAVRKLAETLRERERLCAQASAKAEDYEEYVESWAHEIKTPLSLLTLLLDNRREELPESMGFKLDAIQNRMQEYVEQMLYYARLKSARKDYLFEQIEIRKCVEDVLDDYRILLEEKGFDIVISIPGEKTSGQICDTFGRMPEAVNEATVYADRRGLHFLLSQVISNAVKYSGREPRLEICFAPGGNNRILSVINNGIGVRACDLPHIFDKGFTGDSGENRQKATGIGLYLAREIAREMNLELEAESEWGEGFEMRIIFPVVD